MLVKNFNSFIVNESADSVNDFMAKVREDFDVVDQVKSIISKSIERIDGKPITTFDDFENLIVEETEADETDIAGFNLDKQLDLCIYSEEISSVKCPECSFDDLSGIIYKNAVYGLNYIVEEYLSSFIQKLDTFMKKYNLPYNNIHRFERFGMLAPISQKSIENGSVSLYQEAKEDPKFEEYNYNDEELGIELFITKMNVKK
jgi:uncharacterized protein YlzI (FlbEa/FlbD family)